MFKRAILLMTCCLTLAAATAQNNLLESARSDTPLEDSRKYFEERSWQLVVNTINQSTTDTLSIEARRELMYLRGLATLELQRNVSEPENTVFEELLKQDDADIWAARAYWKSQRGLAYGYLSKTSEPLKLLHRAEEIFGRERPDDTAEFVLSVVNSSLVTARYEDVEDRKYILSFFDKALPYYVESEAITADILLRRETALNAQIENRPPEEYLAGLRAIVQEFPRTAAATRAQLLVAQYYKNRQDLVAALYEYNLFIKHFPDDRQAEHVRNEIEAIHRGEATFTLPGQYLAGDKITFELKSRNTGKVKLMLLPLDVIEELKRQQVLRIDLAAVQGKPVHTQTVETTERQDYKATSRTVTLNYKKPGLYLLNAEVDGKVVYGAVLSISDIAVVGNTGAKGYEFWVVDAATGKPRAGIDIAVAHTPRYEQANNQRPRRYYGKFETLRTDANGFATLNPPAQKANNHENPYQNMQAVATSGGHTALLDNIYWWDPGHQSTIANQVYVYTDRPVYRPEQKVYWRAIVRTAALGEYKLPNMKVADVSITDPKGQEIETFRGVEISEFGTISGEITLPVGAPLGLYHVQVKDTIISSQREMSGAGSFRVEEYKKPEFEVSVEADDAFAKTGQRIQARVQARYLFGAPVTEGTVKYTVRRRVQYRTFWQGLRWHLDDRDLGWFEEEDMRPPTLHGSDGVIVAEGEGKLDANGEYTLSFDSVVADNERSQVMPYRGGFGRYNPLIWPPSPPAWEFQIEATVVDASRRNIDASQVIPVGDKALKLASKTARTIVAPGDNARVELKSMNLADKPVATSGTLYVEKLVWNETHKENDITTLSTEQVSIDTSGSLIVNWRVPDNARGHLRFAFIAEDPFGGESVTYANFYSVTEQDADIRTHYDGAEIIAEKTVYDVGETARVMILSEHRDAVAWYWIDAGSGPIDKKVLPLKNRTTFVSIPITEAFVPNSKVHIVVVRDKRVITDEVELIVPPFSRVISVELMPHAGTVQPGEEGTVTLRATDADGRPVVGEFSVSVYDQAITYIAPDTRADIRRVFYGTRRSLSANITHSLFNVGRYIYQPLRQNYLYMMAAGEEKDKAEAQEGTMAFYAEDAAGMPPPAAAAMPVASRMDADAAGFSARALSREAGIPAMEKISGNLMETRSSAMEADQPPATRTDFRDSMHWSPAVRTDENGMAVVKIKYPDSLTTWRMTAVGLTADTRVGNVTTSTIARKDVLVRLQAPRFFRERDSLVLSGIIHNYSNTDLTMNAVLTVDGIALANADAARQTVTVKAGGEQRIDWPVTVSATTTETARLHLSAVATERTGNTTPGDAMEITVPVLPHGIDKFVAWNGSSRDTATTGVTVQDGADGKVITRTVTIPADRIRETTRLEIHANPSLASSIRHAIPYMIEYPYGCLEQTVSRFIPATVAARAFHTLGYPLDDDLQERLPKVTEQGLARLRDMQLSTGGWGWWANDSENFYMTAHAVYGLTLARDAELAVDAGMFERGVQRLAALRDERTSETTAESRAGWWYGGNLHNLAFAEYVLTLNGRHDARTIDLLWERRDELSAHGLAMLARTLGRTGRQADAEVALRNLVNMAVVTPENDTVRWGRLDAGYRWYDDAVEATAVALMAYIELRPDDPTIHRAAKWLALNRQGTQWKSTRDTAQAVLALTQYLLHTGEAAKPMTIEVSVAGKPIRTLQVDPANFWKFDGTITLRGDEVPEGDFPVSFKVQGEGTLYYSIFAEYFTTEEHITAAGNEIYVTRIYEKLRREKATETVSGQQSAIHRDTWVPLKEGDPIASGDELRVTLRIKSLNDYEYLVFEDPKPAGMEPVDLQSGSRYGNGLCSNMELRDQWVAFFMTRLRQGEHSISYRVRAEIPGTFHVMPTTGYAMYFPPLRTNSDEIVVDVKD